MRLLAPVAQGKADAPTGQAASQRKSARIGVGDRSLQVGQGAGGRRGHAPAPGKSSASSSSEVRSMMPAASGEKGAGCP
jgi:hypothetical protein